MQFTNADGTAVDTRSLAMSFQIPTDNTTWSDGAVFETVTTNDEGLLASRTFSGADGHVWEVITYSSGGATDVQFTSTGALASITDVPVTYNGFNGGDMLYNISSDQYNGGGGAYVSIDGQFHDAAWHGGGAGSGAFDDGGGPAWSGHEVGYVSGGWGESSWNSDGTFDGGSFQANAQAYGGLSSEAASNLGITVYVAALQAEVSVTTSTSSGQSNVVPSAVDPFAAGWAKTDGDAIAYFDSFFHPDTQGAWGTAMGHMDIIISSQLYSDWDSARMSYGREPGPGTYYANGVTSGQISSLAGGNEITTFVNPETGTIFNVTGPGNHILAPGYVMRTVVEDGGGFRVLTMGVGTGAPYFLNPVITPYIWGGTLLDVH